MMKAKVMALCALAAVLAILSVVLAGSLEPAGQPQPTMHTLEQLYHRPIWPMLDKQFVDWPDNPRFAVCDDVYGDMVLDKETGLIWSRDANPFANPTQWIMAKIKCHSNFARGNRRGWRLPTVEELSSLIGPGDPALPQGHPFTNVQSGYYWSSTNYKTSALDHAWAVLMTTGTFEVTSKDKTESHYFWPVRGGSGPETRVW